MDRQLVTIIIWIIIAGIVGLVVYAVWPYVVGALTILGLATAIQMYLRARR